jgi:hypothetical protein
LPQIARGFGAGAVRGHAAFAFFTRKILRTDGTRLAFDRRERLPKFMFNPLNDCCAESSSAITAPKTNTAKIKWRYSYPLLLRKVLKL